MIFFVKIFVDTNILVAALAEQSDNSRKAKSILESENEIYTSLLNIMELRTVLAKKKGFELDEVSEIEASVKDSVEIIIPDSSDFIGSNKSHQESLLYPMDCLILEMAESQDLDLVSFDSELVHQGAVTPEELLDAL